MKLIEFSVKDQVKTSPALMKLSRRSAATGERCYRGRALRGVYLQILQLQEKGITNIETTVDGVLAHRGGVCQDFAHLMLQVRPR